jgi:hypothetical protein
MKDLATNTRDKPSQIFAQVVSQCDDNVQALLPREGNRKRTIRYQRPTPPVSATYADVRLPEEYTTTANSSCNTTTAVVGSGITIDCGIMYVPNGWWKHRWAAS